MIDMRLSPEFEQELVARLADEAVEISERLVAEITEEALIEMYDEVMGRSRHMLAYAALAGLAARSFEDYTRNELSMVAIFMGNMYALGRLDERALQERKRSE